MNFTSNSSLPWSDENENMATLLRDLQESLIGEDNYSLWKNLISSAWNLQRTDTSNRVGEVLFAIISFAVSTIIIPIIKITASTSIAALYRTVGFFIYGERTMNRVVGDESYMYYSYSLVKHFVGFGPLFRYFNTPFSILADLFQTYFKGSA